MGVPPMSHTGILPVSVTAVPAVGSQNRAGTALRLAGETPVPRKTTEKA